MCSSCCQDSRRHARRTVRSLMRLMSKPRPVPGHPVLFNRSHAVHLAQRSGITICEPRRAGLSDQDDEEPGHVFDVRRHTRRRRHSARVDEGEHLHGFRPASVARMGRRAWDVLVHAGSEHAGFEDMAVDVVGPPLAADLLDDLPATAYARLEYFHRTDGANAACRRRRCGGTRRPWGTRMRSSGLRLRAAAPSYVRAAARW